MFPWNNYAYAYDAWQSWQSWNAAAREPRRVPLGFTPGQTTDQITIAR